jgi:monovalent cation:proton antiporter-2 (CPA2) family protein
VSEIHEALIYLAAAVIAVPIFKRLGFGAVLGYLAAGILIGPSILKLITNPESVLHFAELGVVLLLFIIGLELQPSRLWALRRHVFGWGSFQLLVTGGILAAGIAVLGVSVKAAIALGLVLALSSTAFALQSLAERKELTTRQGRSAFTILLFQDIAVVPLLAIVPMLGVSQAGAGGSMDWLLFLRGIGVLVAMVVVGRILLRYVLRIMAQTDVREILTATALLTALGAALIVQAAGLSMALGAFIAGMLLADSEYRHQLEADIEPFKGLLLGLFFIAVGMSVNLGLLLEDPVSVIGLTILLVVVKAAVLYMLGRLQGLKADQARSLAIYLSQGGEFAFVILGVAVTSGVIDMRISEQIIVVVTLSMMATPVLLFLNDLLCARGDDKDREYERPVDEENPVIIAGFGRFGQIIARTLRACGIRFTALDKSPAQVDFVREYGNKIYYGDATRLDLLRAAKAEKARLIVVATDDMADTLKIVELARTHFPNLKIFARARNRNHVYQLMDAGAHFIRRETFHSALRLTEDVLEGLGVSRREAERKVERFREHDRKRLYAGLKYHNNPQRMREMAKTAEEELKALFAEDEVED